MSWCVVLRCGNEWFGKFFGRLRMGEFRFGAKAFGVVKITAGEAGLCWVSYGWVGFLADTARAVG